MLEKDIQIQFLILSKMYKKISKIIHILKTCIIFLIFYTYLFCFGKNDRVGGIANFLILIKFIKFEFVKKLYIRHYKK